MNVYALKSECVGVCVSANECECMSESEGVFVSVR